MSWYRLLLRAYPRAFRERFGQDLQELFEDLYQTRAMTMSGSQRALFWYRVVIDTVRHGLAERLNHRHRRLPLGAHHAKGPSAMSLFAEDIRHATRALRQQPAISAAVLVTLALAIGANSAIFTVINAVLLRPLPFDRPEKVVMLFERDPRSSVAFVSVPTFTDWQQTLQTVDALSLVGWQSVNLTGVQEPDRLRGGFVSADFFRVLGVQPVLGRAFAPEEDDEGASKTVVLAYATWQTRFGSDPAILGRTLMLNNEPHEVIGVLPRVFELPIDDANVWLPITSLPYWADIRDSRTQRAAMVVARVRDQMSRDDVAEELRRSAADLARAYPESNEGWSASLTPLHDVVVRDVDRNLRLLAGAVGLVLLIACANLANLLLARASARQREMAVRAALGASRARLFRQLLAESLLLAIGGGAIGLLLSVALTDAMLSLVPNLPRANHVAPDTSVVLFTAALSVGSGVLFGVLPALRTSRPDLRDSLTETARTGERRGAGRVRSALVVAELALSLMLLVGAGLLVQSLYRTLTVPIGFDPTNVLTLEYRLPRNKYSADADQIAFHERVVEQLATVPGVRAAAISRSVPQSGNGQYVGFWRGTDPQPTRDTMPRAQFNAVSSDYFTVMGIPLFEGRTCAPTDHANAPMVVMVNRMLAERLWPGESAVGKQLRSPDVPGAVPIIGVVGNTRPHLLSDPIAPQIYGCLSQQPGIFASVAIKAESEPLALRRSIQEAIWSVDADQPMWKIRTSASMIDASVQRQRFVMLLMVCAAALALLLAGLGSYSVLSYTVQRRAREVGVRMALGASRASIARLVLGQTALLTLSGIALGLAGAFALSRVVAAQLYEVSPRDPLTFGVTTVTLAVVASIAAWIPTRRATAVDPVITLRAE